MARGWEGPHGPCTRGDARRAQRAPRGPGEARSRRPACRRRRRPRYRARGPARGHELSRRGPLTALGLDAARSNHVAADRSASPPRLPMATPSTPSRGPKAGDELGAARCAAAAARGSAAASAWYSPAASRTGKKTRAMCTLPAYCPCDHATRTCVRNSKRKRGWCPGWSPGAGRFARGAEVRCVRGPRRARGLDARGDAAKRAARPLRRRAGGAVARAHLWASVPSTSSASARRRRRAARAERAPREQNQQWDVRRPGSRASGAHQPSRRRGKRGLDRCYRRPCRSHGRRARE